MAEITRDAVARVGVDLSKRVFQVHAMDRSGRRAFVKPMAPDRLFAWYAGCLVAVEACCGAHHAARRLQLLDLVPKDQVGWQKAVVALANKNARILWAVLTREDTFNANHVPEAPPPHCALSQRPASC